MLPLENKALLKVQIHRIGREICLSTTICLFVVNILSEQQSVVYYWMNALCCIFQFFPPHWKRRRENHQRRIPLQKCCRIAWWWRKGSILHWVSVFWCVASSLQVFGTCCGKKFFHSAKQAQHAKTSSYWCHRQTLPPLDDLFMTSLFLLWSRKAGPCILLWSIRCILLWSISGLCLQICLHLDQPCVLEVERNIIVATQSTSKSEHATVI